MTRRVSFVVLLALAAGAAAGCGKKGPPLPPLRLAPAKVEPFTAERTPAGLRLRFDVPAVNDDGSAPADIVRVDIYAVDLPESERAPVHATLIDPDNRVGAVDVVVPMPAPPADPTPTAKDAPPLPESPAPGASVTWTDTAVTGAPGQVRYYTAVGVSRRDRRGAPSNVLAVPLSPLPAAPAQLTASFTESAIRLDWLGPEASDEIRYAIYRVDEAGAVSEMPITAEPLEETAWEDTNVVLGERRCYAVRVIRAYDAVTVASAPTAPVCVTPADVFPPPAPANLQAVAGEGAISLIWDAVAAPDFAGYLVLRGEAGGDTLAPLFEAPIGETTWRDATVTAGVTYVYAVIALDKAGNRSEQSNRIEETARN